MKAQIRKCWALYHRGSGAFIRAIATKPDAVTRKQMPHIEYVPMSEIKRANPVQSRKKAP